jgi:hypothetical protein
VTSREDLFDVVLTLLGRQAGDVFDVHRILKSVLKRGICSPSFHTGNPVIEAKPTGTTLRSLG